MVRARKRMLLLIGVLICGAVNASATVYRFSPQQPEGSWHARDNWDPEGTPTFGDRAIIPSGYTCIVSEDNAEITILEIQSGGAVRVEDKRLSVGPDEGQIILYGDLEFRGVNGGLCVGRVALRGNGMLFTRPDFAFRFTILPISPDRPACLTVEQGPVVRGCVTIRVNLKNDGLIWADSWRDDILVHGDVTGEPLRISGTGEFRVSGTGLPGGLLRFGHCMPDPDSPFSGCWRVRHGGELRLLETAGSRWTKSAHNVYLEDGTLNLETSFGTSGHLRFGPQGEIRLRGGKTAAFSVAPSD